MCWCLKLTLLRPWFSWVVYLNSQKSILICYLLCGLYGGKNIPNQTKGTIFLVQSRTNIDQYIPSIFFLLVLFFCFAANGPKKRKRGRDPYCKRLVPCNYTIFYSDLVIIEDLRKDIFWGGGGKGGEEGGGKGEKRGYCRWLSSRPCSNNIISILSILHNIQPTGNEQRQTYHLWGGIVLIYWQTLFSY